MAGVLTREQIENEALDNVAKNGVLTLQSSTTLRARTTIWANRAQLWVARRADLLQAQATASTVASQAAYSFPSNFRNIYSIRLIDGTNSRKLSCVMPWQMDNLIPNAAAETTQRSWFYVPYKDAGTFELYPIPDGVYTLKLRYSYWPSDFTSSSATSQFTNCDDALICYTTMFAFRWLQELKDAAYWEKAGDEIVDQAKKLSDEINQFPDWAPVADGFSVSPSAQAGDYYNNPFIRDNVLRTWWS